MRARSPVEYVSEDVKLVDAQPLYQVADGADEFICPSGRDNCFHDTVEISLFVVILGRLMKQFLDDIGKFARK